MYDMTPPGSGDSRIKRPTGGADAFLDFIEHDLKPAVAAAAKVDPGRQAIFGHSLGGQFVLYTMITRPQLFDTYLAASPSMRSEERRVGQECVSTGRSRWSRYH